MFATVREITIREAGGSDSDPVEPLDLSSSCTNRWHLIDAAKFLIRYRRLVGDPISFETTYARACCDRSRRRITSPWPTTKRWRTSTATAP
jgi:hypothetical protein